MHGVSLVQTVDILQRKRDGLELAEQEIEAFVQGYVQGRIPDYQAAAFAMAVAVRGMSPTETLALTTAMLHSGLTLTWPSPPGPLADKHSTGGVGDKTSLVVGPLAAACGLYVPMISGRGLGHTGGTLDKIEAIPGLRVRLSLEEIQRVVRATGLAMAGPTDEIAPADRRLYALRNVTATIDSVPLIAASILSKKMAEGIQALVLDVKFGDGAFMADLPQARILGQTLVSVARKLGCRAQALLTDMSQPLGSAIGNALEVAEAIETLKGRGPRDLQSLSIELAARMLWMAGMANSLELARERARRALSSGAALERFAAVVEAQGGDPRVCEDRGRLPRATRQVVVGSQRDGRVRAIACRQAGRAAMLLGAGRKNLDDRVDPAAGLVLHKKVGELVIEGEPLLTIHGNDPQLVRECHDAVANLYDVRREGPSLRPLIRGVLDDADPPPEDSAE